MRISDWGAAVCSADLHRKGTKTGRPFDRVGQDQMDMAPAFGHAAMLRPKGSDGQRERVEGGAISALFLGKFGGNARSEEHTSELQSLMRISYAVFCLKKKKKKKEIKRS